MTGDPTWDVTDAYPTPWCTLYDCWATPWADCDEDGDPIQRGYCGPHCFYYSEHGGGEDDD